MKEKNESFAERDTEQHAQWPTERFDELLAEPHAAPPALAKRILDDLPAQSRWQRFFDWLTPVDRDGWLWRPAAAALLPLLFGFALGLGVGEQGEDTLYDDVLLLAFTDSYFETNAYGGEGDD